MVYSDDGSQLASASADGNVIIWDTKTYLQIRVFEGAASAASSSSLDFNPDGSAILIVKGAGLKLWDIASGQMLKEYFKPEFLKPGIAEAVFSADGQSIYSCGGAIEKRNVNTGEVIQTFIPQNMSVGNSLFSGFTSLSVSTSQNLLAAASLSDSSVHVFELTSGTWITKIHKNETMINSVRFSNKGNLLAIAHLGGLNVWSVTDKRFSLHMSDSSAFTAQRISFCPDDNCLVMGGLNGYLVRLDFKFVNKRYGTSSEGVYPALNPINTTMAVGINTELRFMNFKTGRVLHKVSGKFTKLLNAEISAQDRYLVSKHNYGDRYKEIFGLSAGNTSYTFWDLKFGKPIRWLTTDDFAADRDQNIYAFSKPDSLFWTYDKGSFSANKKKISRKSYDTIYVHDFETGNRLNKFNGIDNLTSLGFLDKGKSIFVLGEEIDKSGTIRTLGRIIDWTTGKRMVEIKDTIREGRFRLYGNFTVNDKYRKICASGISGKLKCWNFDGQLVFRAENYSAKFSADGELLGRGDMGKLYISFLKKEEDVSIDALLMLSNELFDFNATSRLLATKGSNGFQKEIDVYDLSTKQRERILRGHTDNIKSIRFFNHSDSLVSTAGENVMKLWSPKDTTEIVSLMQVDSTEWIIFTPDNYYMTSKGGTKNIGFRAGNRAYAFEQFDLQYNRPDIILSRLGRSDPALIQSYKKAYEKRLKKMGFSEQNFTSDFHVPEITILNKNDISPNQEKSMITVKIKAVDDRYKIKMVNIFVNNVSIFQTNGFDLTSKNISLFMGDFDVPLSVGRNKIKVSCYNDKGVESLEESLEVQYKPFTVEKPDLYIFTIGVSRYKEAAHNLQYADKDATDMAEWFSTNKASYKSVNSFKILNEEATKKTIVGIKQKLANAKLDDQVIIFYAGHGVLDKNLNYYLST